VTETSTSDTRVYLKVPSPFTGVAIGTFYADSDDDAVDYAGISVNADDHVRLHAKGAPSESDAVLQSYGQSWLQAKNRMSGAAAGSILIGSRGRAVFGASDGVNILAGFTTGTPSSQGSPGTLPGVIERYESKAAIASALWTGFDVAMGVGAAVAGVTQGVVGTGFSWLGSAKIASNLAGAALGIAALGWSRDVALPGMNLFSQGGTYMGAVYGSVNITGSVGLLMGSLFHTKLAIGMARMRGFARASVTSVKTVDFSALLWHEAKSDGEQTIASRAGTLTLRGTKMTVGQLVAVPPQSPTSNLEAVALNEVAVTSPFLVDMGSLVNLDSTALMDNVLKVHSKATLGTAAGLGSQISNIPGKLELRGVSEGASLTCDSSGVEMTEPGLGLARATNSDIQLSSSLGAGKITVVPGASVTVDGTTVDIG